MYGPRRIIRGSACQACHRLKARCLRQPGLNPCARCERNGRECLALDLTGSAVSRSRGPRRVRSITHPELSSDSDGTTDLVELARPILPSIYSISPVDTITGRLELGDNSSYTLSQASASNAAEVYAFSHGISAEYASQLIDFFRERLLLNIPIFDSAEFRDFQSVMSRSPHLVTSICYVTARYIPGCRDIGRTLTPAILTFLENTYTTTIHDADEELAMLQSLMILCTFTRWTLIGKEPNSCCDINFWHVKATSECFARRIKLHLSAAALKMQLEAGKKPSKANAHTRRYLYWLWFYTLSHHTSVVTRNPPSLRADASLRSASTILACLESDENISLLLSEVQLCLLWEKLGVKDISLKEWWCSTELQCSQTSPAFDITFDDVDMALDEWKENSPAKAFEEFRKGILRFNPDYHSHYMRFCLNTYFIRHICSTNLQPDEILGIKRSVDSAVSVLELSCHMNPLMRDQLRYTSGFIIITISFCSNFVLEAIQRFPSIFPDSTEKLTLVSKTATLLCDLDVDKELGACAAGEWIIRRIDAMSKFPNHRQLVSLHQMTVPEAEDGTTPIADVRGEPGMEYLDLWGFNIDQSTLDTTFEFFESF